MGRDDEGGVDSGRAEDAPSDDARLAIPRGSRRADAPAKRGKNVRLAATDRVHAGHNRDIQIVRYPRRKLFNKARKAVFLEWFAATANLGWAAEKAEVCRQTISKHLMSDPEFAGAYEDALKVSRLRLKAKMIETRRAEQPLAAGEAIEPPEIDMPFDRGLAVLREMEREVKLGRKQGRMPRVASNEEVLAALRRRVKALEARVKRRRPEG